MTILVAVGVHLPFDDTHGRARGWPRIAVESIRSWRGIELGSNRRTGGDSGGRRAEHRRLERPCSFASLRWRYPAKRRSPAPWQSSPPDPARIRGQGSSTVRTRKVLRTGKRAATGRGKESRSFLILTRELGLAACLAESWLRRRAQNNGFRLEWQLLSGNLSVSWGLRVFVVKAAEQIPLRREDTIECSKL